MDSEVNALPLTEGCFPVVGYFHDQEPASLRQGDVSYRVTSMRRASAGVTRFTDLAELVPPLPESA